MSNPVIALLTDFGSDSPYVAQLKACILTANPSALIVDIMHSIAPQNIRQAAIVLADVVPHFPAGSIFVVVVDPGVGTDREIVLAKIGGRFLIAPDNGLLSGLALAQTPENIVQLREAKYWNRVVSHTFHGRDIMAPVAAHLSREVDIECFGPTVSSLTMLDWPQPEIDGSKIRGCVWAIDSFGNLITNLRGDELRKHVTVDKAIIKCAGRTIAGIVRTYGERQAGELVALCGSNGHLELAVVNGNAAQLLNIAVDDPVEILFEASGLLP